MRQRKKEFGREADNLCKGSGARENTEHSRNGSGWVKWVVETRGGWKQLEISLLTFILRTERTLGKFKLWHNLIRLPLDGDKGFGGENLKGRMTRLNHPELFPGGNVYWAPADRSASLLWANEDRARHCWCTSRAAWICQWDFTFYKCFFPNRKIRSQIISLWRAYIFLRNVNIHMHPYTHTCIFHRGVLCKERFRINTGLV